MRVECQGCSNLERTEVKGNWGQIIPVYDCPKNNINHWGCCKFRNPPFDLTNIRQKYVDKK